MPCEFVLHNVFLNLMMPVCLIAEILQGTKKVRSYMALDPLAVEILPM